jgi:hypothetical protein
MGQLAERAGRPSRYAWAPATPPRFCAAPERAVTDAPANRDKAGTA